MTTTSHAGPRQHVGEIRRRERLGKPPRFDCRYSLALQYDRNQPVELATMLLASHHRDTDSSPPGCRGPNSLANLPIVAVLRISGVTRSRKQAADFLSKPWSTLPA